MRSRPLLSLIVAETLNKVKLKSQGGLSMLKKIKRIPQSTIILGFIWLLLELSGNFHPLTLVAASVLVGYCAYCINDDSRRDQWNTKELLTHLALILALFGLFESIK